MFKHYCIELSRNGNTRVLGAFLHLQHAMLLHDALRDWRSVIVNSETLNLFQTNPGQAKTLYYDRWRDWQGQAVEGVEV